MVKDNLFAVLVTLAGGNVFGGDAGEAPARPYICYFKVVGTPEHTLDAELAGTARNLFQVDIYAESYEEADALHQSLRAAMGGATFRSVEVSDQDIYEPDTHLHRVLSQWSIWGL